MANYDLLGIGYAAFVALGGAIGYFKKGSTISLVSGLAFGALSGYGASLTSQDPANCHVICGTSAVLAAIMGYRYYNSGKFIPAGLVSSLSLLMVLRYGLRLYQ